MITIEFSLFSSFLNFCDRNIEMDKTWMQESNRFGNRYIEGVNEFISMARSHVDGLDRIKCLCYSCLNRYYKPIDKVQDDLFLKGIDLNYTQWIFHGEEDPFLQNVKGFVQHYFNLSCHLF
jgi:hypothetical protein